MWHGIEHQKGNCLQSESWNQKAEQHFQIFHCSASDCKSASDLGITNTFYQVGKFANTGSTNKDPLYVVFCTSTKLWRKSLVHVQTYEGRQVIIQSKACSCGGGQQLIRDSWEMDSNLHPFLLAICRTKPKLTRDSSTGCQPGDIDTLLPLFKKKVY